VSEIRVGRGLSRWQAVARGVGVMFTTAALVALGDVLEAAGPLASLPHLLALLLLLANLLGYAELAVRSPRPGGAYVNTRQAEREPVAFFTGWSLILASLGLCALLAHGFGVQVVALLRNHLNLACPAWPWAAGLVLLLGPPPCSSCRWHSSSESPCWHSLRSNSIASQPGLGIGKVL
jgi:amino acid transporter